MQTEFQPPPTHTYTHTRKRKRYNPIPNCNYRVMTFGYLIQRQFLIQPHSPLVLCHPQDQERCWLPGLGLEKHPPMVGPERRDTRRDGDGGMGVRTARSDPRAGLPGLQVTQECVHDNPQIHAGHRYATRRLLHVLYGDRWTEVIDSIYLTGGACPRLRAAC